jgi:YD repeat-containing protein
MSTTGEQTLPPPPQPMVVTQQTLRATSGAPFASPSTSHPAGGDPVLGDGELYEQRVDASLAGLGPHYEFKRTYRSRVNFKGALGYSWDHNYDKRIIGVYTVPNDNYIRPYCDGTIYYQDGELNLIRFTADSPYPTAHYTARGLPLVLDEVKDGYGRRRWQIRDGQGQTLAFDSFGYLSSITDVAGNLLTFKWETLPAGTKYPDDAVRGPAMRVTSVSDAARTVHYLYNDDGTLQCVSLGTSCGDAQSRPSQVLAYFSFSQNGDLQQIFHGTATTGEHISYRDDQISTAAPIPYLPVDCLPNTTLDDYCHRLCDGYNAEDPQTCNNLDVYANVKAFCSNWNCHYEGYPQYLVCSQYPGPQRDADALCMGQYNMVPNCVSGCLGRYQCEGAVDLRPHYSFGSVDDLLHNITDITDERGAPIVHNDYGEDPWSISFDRVVSQRLGPPADEPNTLTFEYHDLTLEAHGSPIPQSPGSTPDPTNVVPASAYAENYFCPVSGQCLPGPGGGCSIYNYGDPKPDHYGVRVAATNAVVVHDLHGVTRTQYFDKTWNLIREVNVTDGETTDYNYDDYGFLLGVQAPSGVRSCFVHDGYGHVLQSTVLAAPGYPGSQTPMAAAYHYDAANQLTDEWTDVFGTIAKTHYQRDEHERVVSMDQDVTAGQPPERTLFTYDEDPAPVGIREVPATVVLPDGTVNTFRTIDGSMGGPTIIRFDANGADPEDRYINYDDRGRVREAGESNRYATQYTYDDTNKLVSVAHHLDSKSPWIATEIASHESNGEAVVDSITEPLRYTTYQYLGQYPNVVSYVPDQTTYGASTQTSCLHISADGRKEGEILPVGNELQYAYDAAGRLTSVMKGFPTTPPPALDWRQQCSGRRAPDGDTGPVVVEARSYRPGGFLSSIQVGDVRRNIITDGFGRIIERDAPLSDVKVATTRTGYDSRGQVVWQADFDPSLLPSDPSQKPTMKTAGLLSMVEFDHDLIGRITSERAWVIDTGAILTTSYAYDDLQRTTTVTHRGATTVSTFDGRGRLAIRVFPDQSTLQIMHHLGYDILTRQTIRETPLVRTVQYDTRGDITGI